MRSLLPGISICAALLSAPSLAAEETPPRIQTYAGVSHGPGYLSAYAAGVFAPMGTLHDPGLRLRGLASAGRYAHDVWERHTIQVPLITGEAMLGYAFRLGPGWMTAYAGAHVEHHRNADPDASVNGTLLGAKGQAELWTPLGPDWSASATLSLSTVQWGRYASARLERKFARWTIGPEIAAVGGETYSYLRAGLTAGFPIGQSSLSLSAGQSFDLDGWDGDGTGLYAGVSWSAGF